MSNPQYPNNPGPGYGQQPPPRPPEGNYPPQPGGYPQPGQGGYQPQGGYQKSPQPPPNYSAGPNYAPPPAGYPQQYPAPAPGYGYPQQAAYAGNTGVGAAAVKADFGKRLVSFLIDGVIIFLLYIIPVIIFSIIGAGAAVSDLGTYNPRTGFYEGGAGLGAGLGLIFFGYLIGLALTVAYLVYMISKGQTLGNKVAGMKIVSADGSAPGIGKAFIRTLVMLILSGFFLIGYLWMLWDPEQQTLHDKIAGTYGVVV